MDMGLKELELFEAGRGDKIEETGRGGKVDMGAEEEEKEEEEEEIGAADATGGGGDVEGGAHAGAGQTADGADWAVAAAGRAGWVASAAGGGSKVGPTARSTDGIGTKRCSPEAGASGAGSIAATGKGGMLGFGERGFSRLRRSHSSSMIVKVVKNFSLKFMTL
jgi:hypothetical protein